MPGSDHETTLARQWEILRNHLPSQPPGRSSREIRDRLETAGHNVTKRTVERDLDELSRLFPISRNEISIPYGWHWSKNARFDIPGMELTEALSFGMMETILRQTMPGAFLASLENKFSIAREKLSALSGNRHTHWRELVRYVPPGFPFLPPETSGGVLFAVQDSLLHKRRLEVLYRGPGSDAGKRLVLHPLALLQQGVRSYLLARAFEYETPFLYALHRMRSAKVLDEPVVRPKNFSLDDFLAQGGAGFGNNGEITLKARVSETLANILEETPLSRDQKITRRAGSITLSATVHDSWQLRFWLLSQGPEIIVTRPVSLRKSIISSLEKSLGNYS